MAKAKTDEIDPVLQNPDGTLKTMKQHAEEAAKVPALEAAIAEKVGRITVLEDVLAEVQPLLHRFRKLLPQSRAAEDSNLIYMKVRSTLGSRGEEIDKVMRGQ